DAAWRRHGAEHAGTEGAPSLQAPPRDTSGGIGPDIVILGGAAVAIAALLGGWFLFHKTAIPPPQVATPAAVEAPAATAPHDAALDELLTRAARALANGDLVSPPGANAAELYRQAHGRNPSDPRGANGIEKVIDRLLSAAEAQLLAQHIEA